MYLSTSFLYPHPSANTEQYRCTCNYPPSPDHGRGPSSIEYIPYIHVLYIYIYIYISSIPRRLSTSQTGQQFGKTCSHLRLPIPASTAHATTTSHTDHSEHLGGYLSLSQRAGSSTPPYRPNEISQMSFRAAAAATAATPIAALTDTPPASVAC